MDAIFFKAVFCPVFVFSIVDTVSKEGKVAAERIVGEYGGKGLGKVPRRAH